MRLSWPNLTWRRSRWQNRVYYAKTTDGTRTYKITYDGCAWRLDAWHNGDFIPMDNSDGRTLAQLQQIADDHAAAHAKP